MSLLLSSSWRIYSVLKRSLSATRLRELFNTFGVRPAAAGKTRPLHIEFIPRRLRQLCVLYVLHFLVLQQHVRWKSFENPLVAEACLRS